jgi:HSP20 family molecular chaperone IbpA
MKKGAALDHLFVAPDEIRVFMRRTVGLIEQRAYEIFTSRGSVNGHDFDDWVQAESELLQPVTAELSDAGDAFIAVAAVSSYRPEDLRASVEPRCLTICGLAAGNDNKPGSMDDQSDFAPFCISFRLPADVNTSAASADLRSSVLEIRLRRRLPKRSVGTGTQVHLEDIASSVHLIHRRVCLFTQSSPKQRTCPFSNLPTS